MANDIRERCRVDILGNGGLSFALQKKLVTEALGSDVSEINVWIRKSPQIIESSIQKSDINVDLFNLFKMYKSGAIRENCEKLRFRQFSSLDDLRAIPRESSDHIEKGGRALLIVLSKYRLEELSYVDPRNKSKPLDFGDPKHVAHLAARLKTWLSTTNYDDLRGDNFKKAVLEDRERLLAEGQQIQEAIRVLDRTTRVGYERLYNLTGSFIGVRELSKVLREDGGYRGTIFNMVNSVDTINKIFALVGRIDPSKIISPCEHDRIRAEYFLQKVLSEQGFKVNKLHVEYVGPHNHTGFMPVEAISLELADQAGNKHECAIREAIQTAIRQSNGFGEQVFLSKGSSDEDSVESVYIAMESFLAPGEKPFRASCYLENHDAFTGLNGFFTTDGSFKVSDDFMKYATLESRRQFIAAIYDQRTIDDSLAPILVGREERSRASCKTTDDGYPLKRQIAS